MTTVSEKQIPLLDLRVQHKQIRDQVLAEIVRVVDSQKFILGEEVEKFEQEVLGIHEKLEGLHDDYYITSIIMVHDPNGVRMPERVKAGKFVINGIALAPAAKTIENGKKIVAFRTGKTVAAIRKAIAAR